MLLHAYLLLKAPRGIENGQLLQYGQAYQLNYRMNVKMMAVRMCVLRNSAKTETFAPQNNRAMERNVNFLLIATVHA